MIFIFQQYHRLFSHLKLCLLACFGRMICLDIRIRIVTRLTVFISFIQCAGTCHSYNCRTCYFIYIILCQTFHMILHRGFDCLCNVSICNTGGSSLNMTSQNHGCGTIQKGRRIQLIISVGKSGCIQSVLLVDITILSHKITTCSHTVFAYFLCKIMDKCGCRRYTIHVSVRRHITGDRSI